MSFIIRPWQLFLICLSGWINRKQQYMIEYLITENLVLKEKLGKKRILLNDDQRRRLAVKGKVLGRKLLLEIATIVTPDTILQWWMRELCVSKSVTNPAQGYYSPSPEKLGKVHLPKFLDKQNNLDKI
jgi:hypothetical protein